MVISERQTVRCRPRPAGCHLWVIAANLTPITQSTTHDGAAPLTDQGIHHARASDACDHRGTEAGAADRFAAVHRCQGYAGWALPKTCFAGDSATRPPNRRSPTKCSIQRFDRGGLQVIIKLDTGWAPISLHRFGRHGRVGRQIIDRLKTIDYVQDPITCRSGTSRNWKPGCSSTDKSSTQIVINLSRRRGPRPIRGGTQPARFPGNGTGSDRVGGPGDGVPEVNSQSA